MARIYQECLELSSRKNKDYSGEENPFRNFMLSEHLGICRTEEGIMVRILDKVTRIANLLKNEAAVKDESIEDTLKDLINYSAILLSYIRMYKRNS
jgi:hypothetical protein